MRAWLKAPQSVQPGPTERCAQPLQLARQMCCSSARLPLLGSMQQGRGHIVLPRRPPALTTGWPEAPSCCSSQLFLIKLLVPGILSLLIILVRGAGIAVVVHRVNL